MLEVDRVWMRYELPPRFLRPLVRAAAKEPTLALRDVSFSTGTGEVVGLVGPNGAGKTTLVKLVTTLLDPSQGRIVVDGHDTRREGGAVRARIGIVLAEDRGLYWRLTGRQNLELFGVLSGLSRPEALRRADELLEWLDLAARDKLVFGYSTGMKARLGLARALIARPPLIVLDEPTRSLDPLATTQIHETLRRLARDGHTVLLSSHRLDEVVGLCNRVVVLVQGTVRYVGTPSELGGDQARALGELLAAEVARP
jgi:ABC-2 type transport system ATP-binding protein